MSTRARSLEPQVKNAPVDGLPPVNYHTPMLVTLAAATVLLLVFLLLTLITGATAITQVGLAGSNSPAASGFTLWGCGFVSLICLAATAFFVWSVVKGTRDLVTPIQYTRGTVADKRVIGGRKSGTWLGVVPSYSGPDLAVASEVTGGQLAGGSDRASGSRNQGGGSRKSSGYLSADRISDQAVNETHLLRRIFRIDPNAHAALEPGDEVLVAHSRFLEHIFYVARLNNGEWQSYTNKALI